MCGMPFSVRRITALRSLPAARTGAARRPPAPTAGSAAPALSATLAATPASSHLPRMIPESYPPAAGGAPRPGSGRRGRDRLALFGEQGHERHASVDHVVGGLVDAALAVVGRSAVGVAAHVPLAVIRIGEARAAEVHQLLRQRPALPVSRPPV